MAIFLVFFHHGPDLSASFTGEAANVVEKVRQIGWIGVDLFFVLSGFLVSGLLFDEYDATRSLNIGRFLIRRGFKIIPAFYVLVLVTLVVDLATMSRASMTRLLNDLFFLQSYRPGAWAHAWTLAVEVHFYILLALLLVFLLRRGGREWLRPLPWILAGVMGVVFVFRLIAAPKVVTLMGVLGAIQPTHLRIDVLAAGVLLRYLYNYHREALAPFERGRVLWLALAFVLTWPSIWMDRPHPFYVTALMPTMNWMAFFILVFQATLWPFPASGIFRWLVAPFDYMGKHSYSIYLWHLPMLVWVAEPLVPKTGALQMVCFWALSIGVGCLMSEVLEMPVLRIRNRLFPSATRGKAAV